MHYIAHAGDVIFGIGTSEAEALSNARQWISPGEAHCLRTQECTAALVEMVEECGGDIPWIETDDGIACIVEEARTRIQTEG